MAKAKKDKNVDKTLKDKRLENLKKAVPFSKDNQPSSEAKKKGWANKKLIKEISELTISGTANEIAEKVGEYFGIEPKDIDHETLADLRQLEKAIRKGDTQAYNAYKDRLRGKASQPVDLEGNIKTEVVIKWEEQ